MKQIFYKVLLSGLIFSLYSCGGECPMKAELSRLEADLAAKEAALSALQERTDAEEVIVHTVYLKLKEDLSEDAITDLIKDAKKLGDIEGVRNLQVGTFQDLDDPRAMSDYGLALQMEFADQAAYKAYQDDPVHVALRENLAAFLAGPPATHDFLSQ